MLGGRVPWVQIQTPPFTGCECLLIHTMRITSVSRWGSGGVEWDSVDALPGVGQVFKES